MLRESQLRFACFMTLRVFKALMPAGLMQAEKGEPVCD